MQQSTGFSLFARVLVWAFSRIQKRFIQHQTRYLYPIWAKYNHVLVKNCKYLLILNICFWHSKEPYHSSLIIPFVYGKPLSGRRLDEMPYNHKLWIGHCAFLGVSGYTFQKTIVFVCLEILFYLYLHCSHCAAFHLGLHCLWKCTFRDLSYTKG